MRSCSLDAHFLSHSLAISLSLNIRGQTHGEIATAASSGQYKDMQLGTKPFSTCYNDIF